MKIHQHFASDSINTMLHSKRITKVTLRSQMKAQQLL